jgi:flagellar motility protein MotE (MotC chaperone)
MAQVLRCERQLLSEQEVQDALSCRISFGPDDVTIIDWNTGLLFGRDTEDERAVLEFANVELLEMRHLDQQLDDALDQAYEALSRRTDWRLRWPGTFDADKSQIAQLQVDSALLFERVTNALKLVGDQYLARVSRLASQRFHLEEWDASILRKLETLNSIYGKMSDQAAARRMEVLEWIIILLIAVSIVVSFLPGLAGH